MATRQTTQHWRETIERYYELDQPEEIRSFLALRPHLVDLLLEARALLAQRFGPTSKVRLELLIDPDAVSPDSDALYGIVHSSLDLDAALHALDTFADTWWLDEIPRAAGSLNFDVSFA